MLKMQSLAILVLFLAHIFETLLATADFSFIVSQQGLKEMSNFSFNYGMKYFQETPLILYLNNSNKRLAEVKFIKDEYLLKNMTFDLKDDHIGVSLKNFTFRSNVSVDRDIWPYSPDTELVDLNMTVTDSYFGVSTKNSTTKGRLWLQNCNITRTESTSTTNSKNYYFGKIGIKFVTAYIKSYINDLMCPRVTSVLDFIKTFLSASIPITRFVAENILPADLRKLNLTYNVGEMRVENGRLAAGILISWAKETEKGVKISGKGRTYKLDVEMSESIQHHVTLFIKDIVINEFLSLSKWDFEWLNKDIPLSHPAIPESSRVFLATLCDSCFFRMKVRNSGTPSVSAGEKVLDFGLKESITVQVINPKVNKVTILISFTLYFDGRVRPYVDSGTIRAKVDLVNANISLGESPFPSAWSRFVEKVIEDMIKTTMWPKIKKSIEKITDIRGIPLPSSCGLIPKATALKITKGKFGISTNLRLRDFNFTQCGAEMRNALPTVNTFSLLD